MSCTLNGARVLSMALTIPPMGRWHATVEAEALVVAEGATGTLVLGSASYVGTVGRTSTDGAKCKLELQGGAEWSKILAPRSYRSEVSVRATTVLTDLAREVGGTFGLVVDRDLGAEFCAEATVATHELDAVLGSWWIDPSGAVRSGTRTVAPAASKVLAFDGSTSVVALAPVDAGTLAPGQTVVADGVARVLGTIIITGPTDAMAWCLPRDPIALAIAAMIDRELAKRDYAVREYRIALLNGDYADLVPSNAALPQLRKVRHRPGVPGASAEVTLGSTVLVAFVDGQRSKPVIVGYGGVDTAASEPVELMLAADAVSIDSPDVTVGSSACGVLLGPGALPTGAMVICVGDTVTVGAASGPIGITSQYIPGLPRAKA
jgi:hypothetical protein